MCYVQLSLLGCAGYVRIGNTLTDPMTGSVLHGSNNDRNTWYMPMYFHERWCMLRAADIAKRMVSNVATPMTRDERGKVMVDIAEMKSPVKPKKHFSGTTPENKGEAEFVYTVRENGQLSMF